MIENDGNMIFKKHRKFIIIVVHDVASGDPYGLYRVVVWYNNTQITIYYLFEKNEISNVNNQIIHDDTKQ